MRLAVSLIMIVAVPFLVQPSCASIRDGIAAFEAGDYKNAMSQLVSPADQGEPVAQFFVGQMLEKGLGVAQDLVRAHVYYNRSASKIHKFSKQAAEARDKLQERLTPEQLEKAQDLASQDVKGVSSAPVAIASDDESSCRQLEAIANLTLNNPHPAATGEDTSLGTPTNSFALTIANEAAKVFFTELSDHTLALDLAFHRVSRETISSLFAECGQLSYARWSVVHDRFDLWFNGELRSVAFSVDEDPERQYIDRRWIKTVRLAVYSYAK